MGLQTITKTKLERVSYSIKLDQVQKQKINLDSEIMNGIENGS